jgi:hypothetical protein
MKFERRMSFELDLLPENTNYRDEGCELSPSCLDCPLPDCIYDSPHGKRLLLKRRRDEELVSMYRRGGVTRKELARIYGLSVRSVQRILKNHPPPRRG